MDFLTSLAFVVNFENDTFRLGRGKSRDFETPINTLDPKISAKQVENLDIFIKPSGRYYLDIFVSDYKVRAAIDTGSPRTYVGNSFRKILGASFEKVNANVSIANGATEVVAGETNLTIKICELEKSILVRLIDNLLFVCVLGVDFLKKFGFEIDFGRNCWRCSRIPHFVKFDFDIFLDSSDGLSEISSSQPDQVMELVKKYIDPPGKFLKSTNFAKQIIDIENNPPIRQLERRYSLTIWIAASKIID